TIVRVSVTRDRTSTVRRPDGLPAVFHTSLLASLTYAREGTQWKLLREGAPVDSLADAFIAASDSGEREKVLAEEPDLVGPLLVSAISRQAALEAQRGIYPRAQELYERALDVATRIDDKKLQADALQNIGNALYYHRTFVAPKPSDFPCRSRHFALLPIRVHRCLRHLQGRAGNSRAAQRLTGDCHNAHQHRQRAVRGRRFQRRDRRLSPESRALSRSSQSRRRSAR